MEILCLRLAGDAFVILNSVRERLHFSGRQSTRPRSIGAHWDDVPDDEQADLDAHEALKDLERQTASRAVASMHYFGAARGNRRNTGDNRAHRGARLGRARLILLSGARGQRCSAQGAHSDYRSAR